MSATSHPDTLAQLALQDFERNQFAAAEQKCLRALSADRRHPLALTVLGSLLHSQGRHEEAIRVFNALTQFYPSDAEHWENLGAALRPTGRLEPALAAYHRALELGPHSANLLYNVGVLHIDRSEYEVACKVLTQALELAPSDVGIRCALAQCHCDLLRFEEALAVLGDWDTAANLSPELLAQIAHLLVTMGEARRADAVIERLMASPPEGGRAALVLARVLERVNRLEESRTSLNRAKSNIGARPDPDTSLAEAVLAQREGNHEQARELLTVALQDHTDFLRRHHLLFPLAKSLDALGRFDEAYGTAAEAHRSQVAFLEAALGKKAADELPAITLAREPCDRQDVDTWDDTGSPAPQDSPVFIVAFPRSGTTLLEQTLDAHPLLRSMDERPFLKQALDDVREHGIRYPAGLGNLTASQLQSVRERYWQRVRNKVELSPGQRLVDKNPLNLLRLPLIRRLFPHAHIVLAIRHPCDTLLSCFLQHFRAPDLALQCRDLPTLARSYSRTFDFWYEQAPLLRPAVWEIRYETFVADFAAQVRSLSQFLELPWDDAMLAPGEHARSKGFISTPSYTQVVQPISSRSVGRWNGYAKHFSAVMPELTRQLRRWGYE